jgi:hypothetical protein
MVFMIFSIGVFSLSDLVYRPPRYGDAGGDCELASGHRSLRSVVKNTERRSIGCRHLQRAFDKFGFSLREQLQGLGLEGRFELFVPIFDVHGSP